MRVDTTGFLLKSPRYALHAHAAPPINRRACSLPKCSKMYVAKLSAASSTCPKIGTLKMLNVACPTSCKVAKTNCPTAASAGVTPARLVFFRQRFQYVFQKIVAKSHRWLAILSPVPSIRDAAFRRLDGQLFGQTKRAKDLLNFL